MSLSLARIRDWHRGGDWPIDSRSPFGFRRFRSRIGRKARFERKASDASRIQHDDDCGSIADQAWPAAGDALKQGRTGAVQADARPPIGTAVLTSGGPPRSVDLPASGSRARTARPGRRAGRRESIEMRNEPVLVIDRSRVTRRQITVLVAARYRTYVARGVAEGLRSFQRHAPRIVLVKTARHDEDATALLGCFRACRLRAAVVVLADGIVKRELGRIRGLGACAVLPWPTRCQRFFRALQWAETVAAFGAFRGPQAPAASGRWKPAESRPPVGDEIACPIGRNRVRLEPTRLTDSATGGNRIAVTCPLRAALGLTSEVYDQYVLQRCCGNPLGCCALQILRRRSVGAVDGVGGCGRASMDTDVRSIPGRGSEPSDWRSHHAASSSH